MGRVSLRRLVLNNFRSFEGRHVIDFPVSGTFIIRGRNLDTRGDSGAGKTNILLAIVYAFGFCPYSAKDLQCWHTEKPMSVEVHMDTDVGKAVLVRGDKLSILVGSETVKGSAKAVEARLDQLCGVGDKLREAVTYRDQVEPKKFLSMKDTELKEFLVRVLRLDVLEKEIKARTEELGNLKESASGSEAVLQAFGAEVEQRRQEVVVFVAEDEVGLEAAHITALQKQVAVTEKLAVTRESIVLEQRRVAGEVDASLVEGAERLSVMRSELQSLANAAAVVPTEPEKTEEWTRLSRLLQECELHVGKLEAEEQEKARAYNEFTEKMRAKARDLHNELARAPAIIDNLERLRGEAESLAANVCDRCGRVWEAAKEELAKHQQYIVVSQEMLDKVRSHQPKAKELDRLIGERVFIVNPLLARLRGVYSQLQQKLAAEDEKIRGGLAVGEMMRAHALQILKDKISAAAADLAKLRLQRLTASSELLDNLTAEETRNLEELVAVGEEVRASERGLVLVRQSNQQGMYAATASAARLKAAEARLAVVQGLADHAVATYSVEADYLDVLKGFRSKIFDEVLAEIGAEATDIVGTLPNAAHTTIEFQSERETASGTRTEIKPVVFLHGVPRPLRSSVSGGQLTSISLAVDLAVARVISRRLGCNLNWIILDESFNGQDTVTKASCLEMLQSYAEDKLVIVIDHASEFKELVAQTITVVHEHQHSRIE